MKENKYIKYPKIFKKNESLLGMLVVQRLILNAKHDLSYNNSCHGKKSVAIIIRKGCTAEFYKSFLSPFTVKMERG